jgi:hypothetical protein
MRGRSSSITRKILFFSFLISVSVAVFVFRFSVFGDIEPRSDQAFFSWWVQGLYQADHLFPDVGAGESWLTALQRDDGGFLHRLLRPIYGRALSVFTLVNLGIFYAMTWVLGPTYGAQVATSLLGSALIVLMLGLFPVCASGRRPNGNGLSHKFGIGAVAVLLGATSVHLHFYSPWIIHNYAVSILLIAAALGTRVLAAPTDQLRSMWVVVLVVYGLAFFANWTNLFLLPAATFVSILVVPGLSFKKRMSFVIGFATFSAILAIPFLIAADVEGSRNLVSSSTTVRAFVYSVFFPAAGDLSPSVIQRAVGWLERGSQLFSAAGLVLGILGLAAWARWERVTLPLFIVITHFLVWCAVADFRTAYFRTFVYVAPFLFLGIAYLSVISGQTIWAALKRGALGGKALASVAVLGLLTAHIYIQVPPFFSPQEGRDRVPEAWEMYFSGQGSLKPAMAEIDDILPARAVIVTWGYGIQFLLRNYEIEGPGRTVAPTLLTMIPRFEDGTLPDHIKRRHLSVPIGVPIFTLIDHSLDHVDRESVRQGIESVFGPNGFGVIKKAALEPVGKWRLDSFWPRDVALYRVETN